MKFEEAILKFPQHDRIITQPNISAATHCSARKYRTRRSCAHPPALRPLGHCGPIGACHLRRPEARRPQAGSELRAMYGGLIIGFGAIQWRGYRSMAFRSAAIEATGWIFAGVALGRLAGLLDASCGPPTSLSARRSQPCPRLPFRGDAPRAHQILEHRFSVANKTPWCFDTPCHSL